eukprot:COSAG01_NODE_33253_length_567_cov_1.188034_1_plen_22_part_01
MWLQAQWWFDSIVLQLQYHFQS